MLITVMFAMASCKHLTCPVFKRVVESEYTETLRKLHYHCSLWSLLVCAGGGGKGLRFKGITRNHIRLVS